MKWWELPWNPTIGCDPVDECCKRCWAKSLYERLHKGETFNRVRLCEHVMYKPLHRQSKTSYFVCNLSDLFHKDVPDDYIDDCFAVMHLACWHNFLVLTKRPERAVQLLGSEDAYERRVRAVDRVRQRTGIGGNVGISNPMVSPPKNIAIGITAGLQKHADKRVPLLLKIPAWKRFVSYEPALGPITFKDEWLHSQSAARVDWIVAGGENDPDACDCHLDWLRSLIIQCDSHNVALMIKQLGTYPVDSQLDDWPNGYPHGNQSVKLVSSGFGEYRIQGLKHKAGGDPSEWPFELRKQDVLVLGYPKLQAADVAKSRRKTPPTILGDRDDQGATTP